MTSRPTIAITMGDPAGVGPEISLLACLSAEIQGICRPVIIDACSKQPGSTAGMT